MSEELFYLHGNLKLQEEEYARFSFFIIGVLIIFGVYKVTDNKSQQQQKTKHAVESQLKPGSGNGSENGPGDGLKEQLDNEALD